MIGLHNPVPAIEGQQSFRCHHVFGQADDAIRRLASTRPASTIVLPSSPNWTSLEYTPLRYPDTGRAGHHQILAGGLHSGLLNAFHCGFFPDIRGQMKFTGTDKSKPAPAPHEYPRRKIGL